MPQNASDFSTREIMLKLRCKSTNLMSVSVSFKTSMPFETEFYFYFYFCSGSNKICPHRCVSKAGHVSLTCNSKTTDDDLNVQLLGIT